MTQVDLASAESSPPAQIPLELPEPFPGSKFAVIIGTEEEGNSGMKMEFFASVDLELIWLQVGSRRKMTSIYAVVAGVFAT